MLTATATRKPVNGTTWEEYAIALFRDNELEASFQLYRCLERGTWKRWHLVTFGRYFESPEDACRFLEREWDKDRAEETSAIEQAEHTYRAGYAYACGYYD